MPRTGRRRSLTIAVALIAMLAVPAAAQAATYTVKVGDGPCGGADLACGGLAEAAQAAAPGDAFNVAPGTAPYGSATFAVGGVTIAGAPNFAVNGTLTFTGDTGGVSKLQHAGVVEQTGTAPAVVVTGASGLEISDSAVASANDDAVTFSAGAANKIVRSVVATTGAATNAVLVTSSDTSSSLKKLTAESSLFTGGDAAVAVVTGNSALTTSAGNVDVTLRHVTAAGATHGLRLDSSHASPLLGGPYGNITADVTDSIIQNGTSKTVYPGLLLIAPANTITDTYDLQTLRGTFDSDAVFANAASHNYRLRPGSPAIDKGGFTAGESATDFEGDPRPGPTTDLGADEYVNAPPTAVLEVKTNPQRSGQPVAFDASKSSDRETGFGGGIVRYHWDFGDRQSADTTTPTTTHTYAREGTGTVTLTVADAQGAVSAPVTAVVNVVDGAPPAVVITKPFANQKIKLTTVTTRTKTTTVTKNGKKVKVKKKTRTSKKTKIGFAGTAKDKSGVKGVVITIERISKTVSAPKKKKTTTKKSKTAAKSSQATPPKRCNWLDPARGVVTRSCTKPVLILAKLAKDGTWTYALKSTLKLSAGAYRIIAAGQDSAGATGNSAPVGDAIHRFTLVK